MTADIEQGIRDEERHLVTKAFLQVLLTSGLLNPQNTPAVTAAVNELTEAMRTAGTLN